MVKVIDNKLITLRDIAGYSLEPVVSLWYAKKRAKKYEKKGENYGKQTQTARGRLRPLPVADEGSKKEWQ